MTKDTKMALGLSAIGVVMLVGYVMLGRQSNVPTSDVVRIEDGVQIIDMSAQGGYSPSSIVAQANVPTALHVVTNGTYDCSTVMVIPQLGVQRTLKPTGTEVITIPSDKAVGTLRGSCGMGMYDFEIRFD